MKRDGSIKGMNSLESETLDKPGFSSNASHITKKGTPVTTGAEIGYVFNKLPPGMDITNQDVTDQRSMPMKKLVDLSYPGDSPFPAKDVPE